MQDDLMRIRRLATTCLKYIADDSMWAHSWGRKKILTKLQRIVTIVDKDIPRNEIKREKKDIEAMRHWFGPLYKRDNAEWLAEKKDDRRAPRV